MFVLTFVFNTFRYFKNLVLYRINYFLFFQINNIKRGSIIHIYDIDNTLTETWKYIKRNENDFYRNLYFSDGMKFLINDLYKNTYVLFFSVRPVTRWNDTRIWLSNNLIKFKWFHLFLFSSPKHKIDFILKLHELGFSIVFTDDLSYNHENGEVKFYTEEISRIKKTKISYVAYDEIIKINKL